MRFDVVTLFPEIFSAVRDCGITARARHDGYIEAQELGLPVRSTGLALPCGSSARFIGR